MRPWSRPFVIAIVLGASLGPAARGGPDRTLVADFATLDDRASIARTSAAMSEGQLREAWAVVQLMNHDGEYARAIDRARALAHLGVPEAQVLLGTMLARAYGAPRDVEAALHWMSLGARDDDRDAAALIEWLEDRLDPATADRIRTAYWEPGPWEPEVDTRRLYGMNYPRLTHAKVVLEEKVPPRYPESARVERAEGQVLLGVVVPRDGVPEELRVLSADPPGLGFEEAALDAVSQWRYEPAVLDNEPVESFLVVFIEFKLH